MNNFSKILKEKRYTEALIEDINLSTNNLENMNLDELEAISQNINILMGAIDDLKTSLAEEKAKKEPKNVVNNILEGYIKKADGINDVENIKTSEEDVKNETKKEKDFGRETKNEEKVEVPEIIELLIELSNKYNFRIPTISDGNIRRLIKEKKISINPYDMSKFAQIISVFLAADEVDIADKKRIKNAIQKAKYYNERIFSNGSLESDIVRLLHRR